MPRLGEWRGVPDPDAGRSEKATIWAEIEVENDRLVTVEFKCHESGFDVPKCDRRAQAGRSKPTAIGTERNCKGSIGFLKYSLYLSRGRIVEPNRTDHVA